MLVRRSQNVWLDRLDHRLKITSWSKLTWPGGEALGYPFWSLRITAERARVTELGRTKVETLCRVQRNLKTMHFQRSRFDALSLWIQRWQASVFWMHQLKPKQECLQAVVKAPNSETNLERSSVCRRTIWLSTLAMPENWVQQSSSESLWNVSQSATRLLCQTNEVATLLWHKKLFMKRLEWFQWSRLAMRVSYCLNAVAFQLKSSGVCATGPSIHSANCPKERRSVRVPDRCTNWFSSFPCQRSWWTIRFSIEWQFSSQ